MAALGLLLFHSMSQRAMRGTETVEIKKSFDLKRVDLARSTLKIGLSQARSVSNVGRRFTCLVKFKSLFGLSRTTIVRLGILVSKRPNSKINLFLTAPMTNSRTSRLELV
jgi:hypothetical protein